jgi:hypothetical protein
MTCNSHNKLENFLNAIKNSLNEQQPATFIDKISTCHNLLEECIPECDHNDISRVTPSNKQTD